jgi:putative NADH-flavin reductase
LAIGIAETSASSSDLATAIAGCFDNDVSSVEGELVADEDGESYITMEDFAVAFVDELESGDAIHTQLGVGY